MEGSASLVLEYLKCKLEVDHSIADLPGLPVKEVSFFKKKVYEFCSRYLWVHLVWVL